MKVDRRQLLAGLGGAAALARMSDEAKADALESHLIAQTSTAAPFPTAKEIEEQIETRPRRRGVGNLFVSDRGNVRRLEPLPDKPTLSDYFRLRFMATANHCLQSANRAMSTGMSEEIVLACLLHDTVQELIKVDHGGIRRRPGRAHVAFDLDARSSLVIFATLSGEIDEAAASG